MWSVGAQYWNLAVVICGNAILYVSELLRHRKEYSSVKFLNAAKQQCVVPAVENQFQQKRDNRSIFEESVEDFLTIQNVLSAKFPKPKYNNLH